jgi:tetraacyldisaccharide 4'-kinase
MAAALLAPVAVCYGAIARRRLAAAGRSVGIPVICIGNPTVGGAGKTPTALAVGRLLLAAGKHPFFLSRGYGGELSATNRCCLPALPRPSSRKIASRGPTRRAPPAPMSS